MNTMLETVAACTPAEARDLTEKIKHTAEDLSALLLEAHSRGAWKALGYDSWRAYATAELSISQSRAYQLLDHAKVVAAIQAAAGEDFSTKLEITERDARDLKPDLSEVTEKIRERVQAGEEPAAVVAAVVEEARAEISSLVEKEPETEEEDDFGHTAADELERADARIRELEAMVDLLSADDKVAALKAERLRSDQLNGRLQQEMTARAEAVKQAKYYSGILKRVRKALGVEKDSEIPAALEARLS